MPTGVDEGGVKPARYDSSTQRVACLSHETAGNRMGVPNSPGTRPLRIQSPDGMRSTKGPLLKDTAQDPWALTSRQIEPPHPIAEYLLDQEVGKASVHGETDSAASPPPDSIAYSPPLFYFGSFRGAGTVNGYSEIRQ